MPADQTRVGPNTPMGANLVPGGCTFRAWAPRAQAVYVAGSFNGWQHGRGDCLFVRDANGYWGGFLPGVQSRARNTNSMSPGPVRRASSATHMRAK